MFKFIQICTNPNTLWETCLLQSKSFSHCMQHINVYVCEELLYIFISGNKCVHKRFSNFDKLN